MARKLEITLGNETGIAELYKDEAPETIDAVWEALPWHTTRMQHAKVSGHEVFNAAPVVMEEEENPAWDIEPGEFGYYIGYPAFVWFYHEAEPSAPPNIMGKITENLEGIQHEGRRVWKENNVSMTIEKLEE